MKIDRFQANQSPPFQIEIDSYAAKLEVQIAKAKEKHSIPDPKGTTKTNTRNVIINEMKEDKTVFPKK